MEGVRFHARPIANGASTQRISRKKRSSRSRPFAIIASEHAYDRRIDVGAPKGSPATTATFSCSSSASASSAGAESVLPL